MHRLRSINHLLILLMVISVNADVSPLCSKYCDCKAEEDKLFYDCTKLNNNITEEIYKESNFFKDNITLYDIYTLNLTGQTFLVLKNIIPKSNLKILDLSNTDLTEIWYNKTLGVGMFANLQDMVELNLGYNRLEELSPDTFKGIRVDFEDYPLKSLKILRLNNNQFTSIHNDAFQHIELTLEELYLQGNHLKSHYPELKLYQHVLDISTSQAIHGLRKLRILDLSSNEMEALPQDFLHTNDKLEELYLGYNHITNITCLGLERANALKKLVLDGNLFVNITEETAFPAVPTLEVLHLCEMPYLELIGNHSMCALSNLKELYMSANSRLHTIGPNTLIRVENGSEVPVVQSIEKLYLSNNALTKLQMEINLDRLKDLDISGNPFTCEFENQWIVDTLMPVYCKFGEDRCKALRCAAPVEMEEFTLYELHERKYHMRHLDAYGNHPENDGVILVCFMLGMLIGIIVILGGVYAWKRHWFGLFDSSPAAYSRQFYGRTSNPDEFIE